MRNQAKNMQKDGPPSEQLLGSQTHSLLSYGVLHPHQLSSRCRIRYPVLLIRSTSLLRSLLVAQIPPELCTGAVTQYFDELLQEVRWAAPPLFNEFRGCITIFVLMKRRTKQPLHKTHNDIEAHTTRKSTGTSESRIETYIPLAVGSKIAKF